MLHFAPRYGIVSPCLARARKVRLGKPANDNGASARGHQTGANDQMTTREDALLEAALKLFAAHGLSAARRACEAAEIAAAGGDQTRAEWWLSVCAMFDGAMARAWQAREIAGR